jgi:hypothetical protein
LIQVSRFKPQVIRKDQSQRLIHQNRFKAADTQPANASSRGLADSI